MPGAPSAEVPQSVPAKPAVVELSQPQVSASAEASPAKEVQQKPTLWQEMKSTAKVMINQATAEVKRQIDEATGDKGKIDTILADKKNSVLFTLDQIRSLKAGGVISFKNVDQQVTIVDASGWKNTIVGLQSVDGNTFYAVVVDANNKVPHLLNEPVNKQDLEQAHLLQKLAPQLGAFPESQGKIIQLYLESVKSGKEPASLPGNSEKMLLEAATSAGILTSNDVDLLLKKVLPNQEAGPDATASEITKIKEENERLSNKRARLLKPFTDHGIVITEPQQIISLLNNLGVGATQLSEIRNQSAIEATRLNLLIKANEKMIGKEIKLNGKVVKLTKEMYRQWQEDKVKAEEFSAASLGVMDTFNKDGPIKQYFDELNAGTLPQELGRQIVESFQTGKITEPPDVKTAADEQARIKLVKMHKIWQRQDILAKTGKVTMVSGISLLGILGAFGFMGMRKKET